jgi:hypothetical protein
MKENGNALIWHALRAAQHARVNNEEAAKIS